MGMTTRVTKPLSDLIESLDDCCKDDCGGKTECVICSVTFSIDKIHDEADDLELKYDAILKMCANKKEGE